MARLINDQDGVVARGQVLACGLDSALVRRRLRRGTWVTLYPGVYVTHTGLLTWGQRAWAAVLDAEPAALSHQSAIRIASRKPNDGPVDEVIHIAVPAGRHVSARPGVVVHHRRTYDTDVHAHFTPPRVRFDDAVVDVAAQADDEIALVSILATAIGNRQTTADRLINVVGRRRRLRRRSLIVAMLEDVRDGTCSTLEHEYYVKVEKPHGLPSPERQAPTYTQRPGFRDLLYQRLGVAVELDGRLFHDSARARDRDLDRDLDAAVEQDLQTIRLGWGQSSVRACATAVKMGRLFVKNGWDGTPTPCSRPDCAVRRG